MTQTNYMQVIELTDEEQIELYLKCSKRKLAEMLTEANKHLKKFSGVVHQSGGYTLNELKHIAVNYAINCEKGYKGSFDGWFNASGDWLGIANRKKSIEFRPNIEDVDEIVAHNAFIHLEYLDQWDIWMSIETEKEKYQVHIQPRNKRSNASLLTFAEKIG